MTTTSQAQRNVDVLVIGAGPAGTTCAGLMKKYEPDLEVLIVDRSAFPRPQVGESMLPGVGGVLDELGAWEAIEAEGFPVKIGGTYTWGRNRDAWKIDFLSQEEVHAFERPGRFEGVRTNTSFHVDRERYDEILLDHARSLGVQVVLGKGVSDITYHPETDMVRSVTLDDGTQIQASQVIDASGHAHLLRRHLQIGQYRPRHLQNIAVWTHWLGAQWIDEPFDNVTRVQIRSLDNGWAWIIPISHDRTSIGVVCPVAHLRESGLDSQQLYEHAIKQHPELAEVTKHAEPAALLDSRHSWANLADRISGTNWLIAGEACGFADPILTAGLLLAHNSGRDAAYTTLERLRNRHDPKWLTERYDQTHRTAIRQHIMFAQYWYAANTCFEDLQSHCAAIAEEAGLSLSPQAAWQWLAQGGFTEEHAGYAILGNYDLADVKDLIQRFDPEARPVSSFLAQYNRFELDTANATEGQTGLPRQGQIHLVASLTKPGLPSIALTGPAAAILGALRKTDDIAAVIADLESYFSSEGHTGAGLSHCVGLCTNVLEYLCESGWMKYRYEPGSPLMKTVAAGATSTAN